MDITQIDKNFKTEIGLKLTDVKFYSPQKAPFRLSGVAFDGDRYTRMPSAEASKVSEAVALLCSNTAGGRVRFRTDSSYVAVLAEIDRACRVPHMAATGSIGFDLSVCEDGRQKHSATFVPGENERYEGINDLGDNRMRDLTLHFPLYSDVKSIYIGLQENARVLPPEDFSVKLPVVYYGSSITQGGCASRPSSSYQDMLSGRLNIDYINLGFSGAAKGETAMAEYIAKLDMSAFVMDYDHNAESPEKLEKTHEPFYKLIRNARPDLPILIMSRPGSLKQPDSPAQREDNLKRLEIVRKTYRNAVAAGDKNVWFINGMTLFDEIDGNGTVDRCHPTDLGFWSMANKIEPVLRDMLKL